MNRDNMSVKAAIKKEILSVSLVCHREGRKKRFCLLPCEMIKKLQIPGKDDVH